MNETYVECLVERKKSALFSVVKYVLYGFAIACVLWAFLGAIAMFLVAIVFAGAAYIIVPTFDIEYEYLYLDREISIDKVTAKSRRKRVMNIDLNKMEMFAPSTSHEFDSYNNRQHVDKDFSSGREDVKTYTIAYADNEQFTLVKFEPSEELIKAVKTVFPRKVIEY